MTFIRLLHLLAHHPDFSTVPEDLMDIAKCARIPLISGTPCWLLEQIYPILSRPCGIRGDDFATISPGDERQDSPRRRIAQLQWGRHECRFWVRYYTTFVAELLCYLWDGTRNHQGPCSPKFLEHPELSRQSEVAIGYFTSSTEPRDSKQGKTIRIGYQKCHLNDIPWGC